MTVTTHNILASSINQLWDLRTLISIFIFTGISLPLIPICSNLLPILFLLELLCIIKDITFYSINLEEDYIIKSSGLYLSSKVIILLSELRVSLGNNPV